MSDGNIVNYIRSTEAIRERSRMLTAYVERGESAYFRIDDSEWPRAVKYVLDEITSNYPDLDVPYHSRWRHFGNERLARLVELPSDPLARGRSLYDLVIISVLLDAGAGMSWRYKDQLRGTTASKSEGLALASFDLVESGGLSADPASTWQVNASRLASLSLEDLERAFQVTTANPLVGSEGRVNLMRALGKQLSQKPDLFGRGDARPGLLFDRIVARARGKEIPAVEVLHLVLEGFSEIWPGRLKIGDVSLGDVWTHKALHRAKPGPGLIPFHKLSQWLTYSLCEPLEDYGIRVTHMDDLTGLPEYRNGGLFLDLGVIKLKVAKDSLPSLTPESEPIVEWRALTVTLLDRMATAIRQATNQTKETMPLAKVLQGGTWSAGRRIAKELRPEDGGPPLALQSDGTVF